MRSRIAMPRLLPATICVLALVLTVKLGLLVQTAVEHGPTAALVAAAFASGPEPPPAPERRGMEKTAPPVPKPDAEKQPRVAEPARPDERPSISDAAPPVTDSEKAVLLDLRDRRRELEAREAGLAARESMLVAAEKKLSGRIEELQGLQKKLESLDSGRRQQEDAAWQGLVKVYETMKPRDAAAIFNDLGMPVLLAVVGRMKEAKAAAILAAMSPDKARDVTTQLAQSRTKAAAAVEGSSKPASGAEPPRPPGSGT